jgi:phage gp46-like protein
MSDVKLTFDAAIGDYDVAIVNGDLEADHGLDTAVVISLFSDRRVPDGEAKPEHTRNRRGWWADETLPDSDQIGSLLWLLQREKITNEMIKRAKNYAEDALAWMINDGVAESVSCAITREGLYGLVFLITITQPENVVHRYKLPWSVMAVAA